jgi:acyl-CoA reductase-like NAD-dependent aldehyde dehydrogenase
MMESKLPLEQSHFVNGRAVKGLGDENTFFIHANPSTAEPLLLIPRGSKEEAERAVSAAEAAYKQWSNFSLEERVSQLLSAADRIEQSIDRLTEVDVLETGKATSLARALAQSAPQHIRDFVRAFGDLSDRALEGGHRQLLDSRGVVAVVVPWNAAVEVVMRTLPAVLLLGNTAVIKPSERAPWAVRELIELLGLPSGVVNVLMGDASAGAPLVADPRVKLVIHTGSVESGRAIAAACAAQLKPAILELGGKDPVIVDRDVDVEWAASIVATGSWINAGQLCTAIERIYIDKLIANEFVDALVQKAESEVVGPGSEPLSTMGPLIDKRMLDLVSNQVHSAINKGAKVLTGGKQIERPGWFYPPTVLVDVSHEMEVVLEETFGPVAPVMVVEDLDEAVDRANNSRFGLAATVLTNRAEGVAAARKLQAGTVWVNNYLAGTPGGRCLPRGESGLGAVGDRRAVIEAIGAPRVLHLAKGSADWYRTIS